MSTSGTQFGNVLEWCIAQGMIGSSQFLLVNQQGKATLDHQACDRAVADQDLILPGKQCSDFCRCAAGPLHAAGWVSSRIVGESFLYMVHYFRFFFRWTDARHRIF